MMTKELTNALIVATLTDGTVKRAGLSQGMDMNSVTQSGFYVCDKPAGLPAKMYQYGLLVVINGGSRILQLFYPDAMGNQSNKIPIFRMKVGSTSEWSAWCNFLNELIE